MMKGKSDKGLEKMDTIIGQGGYFEGTITVHGGTRIDGKFKGDIKIEGLLVVGKTGVIEGEIFAKNAIIGGHVTGKMKIAEKVEFQSGARFKGEVVCKGLIIQDGVIFDGTCSMTEEGVAKPGQAQSK